MLGGLRFGQVGTHGGPGPEHRIPMGFVKSKLYKFWKNVPKLYIFCWSDALRLGKSLKLGDEFCKIIKQLTFCRFDNKIYIDLTYSSGLYANVIRKIEQNII